MTNEERVKNRYSGIQTILKSCGDEGCHFLTLLSIAETESKKNIDLINAIRICQSKGWIRSDFFVKNDGTPILKFFTGKEWVREEVAKLPVAIRDEQYTEAIWFNPGTKFHHYRRRCFDTLENSNTVANGYIEKFYIYTCNR